MKIKFIYPQKDLPASMLRLGYSPSVDLNLSDGEEKTVYGISIWQGVVHYLVVPAKVMLPFWYPADLFKVIDPSIPTTWYFKYLGETDSSGILIKAGYKEMIFDDDHDAELIERQGNALKVFLNRKQEIDKES